MVRSSERTGPSTGVRRPVARTAAAARARQVPFDLAPCQLHLLEHQLRQRAGVRRAALARIASGVCTACARLPAWCARCTMSAFRSARG
jgi:hypothetical protein